jgi:hypothetical protein
MYSFFGDKYVTFTKSLRVNIASQALHKKLRCRLQTSPGQTFWAAYNITY